jgi:hypothetical protein
MPESELGQLLPSGCKLSLSSAWTREPVLYRDEGPFDTPM